MTKKQKISIITGFQVADHIGIYGATYRQALSYLLSLRLSGTPGLYAKPICRRPELN